MKTYIKNKISNLKEQSFSYLGYIFIPALTFKELDLKSNLCSVSHFLYNTQQHPCFSNKVNFGTDDWDHSKFYEAAGDTVADIFLCMEDKKFYCPCQNTLFLFIHPLLEEIRAELWPEIVYKKDVEKEKDIVKRCTEKMRETDKLLNDNSELINKVLKQTIREILKGKDYLNIEEWGDETDKNADTCIAAYDGQGPCDEGRVIGIFFNDKEEKSYSVTIKGAWDTHDIDEDNISTKEELRLIEMLNKLTSDDGWEIADGVAIQKEKSSC